MDSNLGRLPDFIVIGAAKSGTTTLFRHLCRHPGIFGSKPKEPCFFDPEAAWDRGFGWYRSLFAGARDDQVCGEASTNYTRFPQVTGVPERIHAAIPQVRLIYIMRHPVRRAFSHYEHRFSRELHPRRPFDVPFADFVAQDPMCLDSSDYALQIERYLEYFPREQLLLLRFEQLKNDPASLMDRVQRFLGVEVLPLCAEDDAVANATKSIREIRLRRQLLDPFRRVPGVRRIARHVPRAWKDAAFDALRRTPRGRETTRAFEPPPMLEETRRLLLERFRPSVERVEALTGEDLTAWKR